MGDAGTLIGEFTSVNGLFKYTVYDTTGDAYTISADDMNTYMTIVHQSFNRWDSIVSFPNKFYVTTTDENGNTTTTPPVIEIEFQFTTFSIAGVLGSAQLLSWRNTSSTSAKFGDEIATRSRIKFNYLYLDDGSYLRKHNDDRTGLEHVILHEIGHVLGIGIFWNRNPSYEAPIVSYTEDDETKYYYTGENALREYRYYFEDDDNEFLGVPIEDDGGSGTRLVHPEESGGAPGITSYYDRYIDGILHPGLDTELMTGWMDGFPAAIPLSRITLGFLEDLGLEVDYNKADIFMGKPEGPIPTCFPKGTPIQTDQGEVAIDKLVTSEHTIRGKQIVAITQTRPLQKHIVCFDEGSLGKNTPSKKTYCSKEHKVYYNGEMIKARDIVNMCSGVNMVEYNRETLFNVLLEKHGKMIVNNMICETLHPENIAAKIAKTKKCNMKRNLVK